MVNENEKQALVVMDVQSGILSLIQNKEEYVAKVVDAVAHAHTKGIQVIFVVVGFRPGAPEAKESQKARVDALTNPEPIIAPEDKDIVVTKRRVSAFSGSDLEVVLRTQGIRHLILAGVSTSGVVLSTTREAADKDYTLTILSDLCADADPEVHTVLTTKVFPKQATVMTGDEWMKM